MDSATTLVPATTANLGPGYDCLGVALTVANRVTVSRAARADAHPKIVEEAATAFFGATTEAAFPFSWTIQGDVPRSRGLGSSVTVRLGVLHGLNALTGSPLSIEELFRICAELEGHPDNAAPAAFGGLAICRGMARPIHVAVPDALKFVLLIPDFEIATSDARRMLPETVPHREAAASLANACWITAAFLSGNLTLLKGAWRDYLHQPYRESLIPILPRVIEAAESAGALGGFLSGSGSTICAPTLENPEAVAAAMAHAAGDSPTYKTLIATADNRGATIVETT
jgi:homoserine kinase